MNLGVIDALLMRHDELEIVATMRDVTVNQKFSLYGLAHLLAGRLKKRGMHS